MANCHGCACTSMDTHGHPWTSIASTKGFMLCMSGGQRWGLGVKDSGGARQHPLIRSPPYTWCHHCLGFKVCSNSVHQLVASTQCINSVRQLGASTRCVNTSCASTPRVNSVRQLGASTWCVNSVRQLGASTRCINSVRQHVSCVNSVHQLGPYITPSAGACS